MWSKCHCDALELRIENREEEETTRIGPGTMVSKEGQAAKNLSMDHANQENEKKDEKEQVANKGEPLALPSEAGDYRVPRVNPGQFGVRQPILQCSWDMIQRPGTAGKDGKRIWKGLGRR